MSEDPHIYKDHLKNSKPMYLDPHFRCLLGYGFVNTTNATFTYNLGDINKDVDYWSIVFDFPNYYEHPEKKYEEITLYINKRTRGLHIGFDNSEKVQIRSNMMSVYVYSFDIDIDEINDEYFQITIDRYLDLCERMHKAKEGDINE